MKIYKKVVDKNKSEVNLWVQEIIDILSKYFNMLQDGTHIYVIPDPFNTEITKEYADKIVEAIDDDIDKNESWRLGGYMRYRGMPEFGRLCDNARIAMAQEIKKKRKYQEEHWDDYLCDHWFERLAK